MPAPDTPAKPARPTLAGQLAAQHELLMAQATKSARSTPDTVELAERHTGGRDGELRIGTVSLVKREDESDVQFLGRLEETTRNVIKIRDTLNVEQAAARADSNGEAS